MTRFHKFCLLFLLLIKPAQAQTVSPLITEARAGEVFTLEVYISEPADSINIYRKTGVTTAPSLVGSIAVRPEVWVYTWSYTMPGGSTAQYRFWAVTKKDGVLLDESNGVRVKRKK